jgi:hypothetical protein
MKAEERRFRPAPGGLAAAPPIRIGGNPLAGRSASSGPRLQHWPDRLSRGLYDAAFPRFAAMHKTQPSHAWLCIPFEPTAHYLSGIEQHRFKRGQENEHDPQLPQLAPLP